MKFNFKSELLRILPLLVALGLILFDDARGVVWFYFGITLFFAYVSHVLRKIYFPYISLRVLAEKAQEQPMSSAVVFAAVTYLLATIIQTSVTLVK